jgi:hypothetical protein
MGDGLAGGLLRLDRLPVGCALLRRRNDVSWAWRGLVARWAVVGWEGFGWVSSGRPGPVMCPWFTLRAAK